MNYRTLLAIAAAWTVPAEAAEPPRGTGGAEQTLVVCDLCSERQRRARAIEGHAKTVAVVDRYGGPNMKVYAVRARETKADSEFLVSLLPESDAPAFAAEALARFRQVMDLDDITVPDEVFASAKVAAASTRSRDTLTAWVEQLFTSRLGLGEPVGFSILALLADYDRTSTLVFSDGTTSEVEVSIGVAFDNPRLLVANAAYVSGSDGARQEAEEYTTE